ncbi:glycosyltransferase [Cetobacterium sp.]|uniref:glycosyltransferase n=1 Tax=Cetobacterium sp. TaxID=2071632 RepID=UPI003EE4ED1C
MKNFLKKRAPKLFEILKKIVKQILKVKSKCVKKEIHMINVPHNVKQDIIFLSIISYDFRYQRPQHIANYLSKNNHRVFYFDSDFRNDFEEKTEYLKIVKLDGTSIGKNNIYSLDQEKDFLKIYKYLDELIKNKIISDGVVVVEYPNWYPIAKYLKNKYGFKVIYDYLDDFSGFHTSTKELLEYNENMLNLADEVIATSQFLYDRVESLTKDKKISLIRNGTESSHFEKAYVEKTSNKRPIIGYYGAIAQWFDMEKIEYIAENRPEYDFVLIGDYSYANIDKISKLSNVKLLGEKDYKDLPNYLREFDVALISFKTDIDLIKATNPVKFYEYLSAGKKIVATEIPELEEFKDKYVYLSNSNNKFLEYIDLCIEGKDGLASPEECREFAKKHDWQERCISFEKRIDSLYSLVSIVMVTYNNLEVTKKCIESIERNTAYPNYEVIIVDNQSKDDTPNYLKELAIKNSKIKIILNDENKGFSGGNNDGLRIAKGEYIILLNNDTLVTRGWISNFIKNLEKNQEIGMMCPVTNSIGNEAQIDVPYENKEELESFAWEYTNKHLNELYREIGALAMFCVIMRRDVFEEVGYLEEAFGIGMFEDDDYSRRVEKIGYQIACCEDVFIHHFGSVSFKKLEDENYKKLFERNKAIYESKWGEWRPHCYRNGIYIIDNNNSLKINNY